MILHGDCLEKLKELDENSIDSVCTDPPYGWRFMGKAWDDADILVKSSQAKRPGETYVGTDGITRQTRADASMAAGKYDQSLEGNEAFCAWTEMYARELLRVLKPGAHALIFCGPRTYHAMAFGVERAGFEIRDQLQWLFGSGFPKSYNGEWGGTALKPANEPICLARKPLSEKTVKANFEKWGVGGLNIEASRIGTELVEKGRANRGKHKSTAMNELRGQNMVCGEAQGRWPANLLLDEWDEPVLTLQDSIPEATKSA